MKLENLSRVETKQVESGSSRAWRMPQEDKILSFWDVRWGLDGARFEVQVQKFELGHSGIWRMPWKDKIMSFWGMRQAQEDTQDKMEAREG